jgi:NTE family protein
MSGKAKMPRVGVALSGGAALGIAHIGVLRSLLDHDIPVNSIAGTSAGAIIAACYAFDVPLDRVAEKARGLSWYALSKLSFSALGLVSNAALGKLIHEFLGNVNIEDAKIPLAIVATDIETGERVVFRRGPLTEALMASTCIPGIFVPVKVGDRLLVDGGLVDNLPFSVLPEMGAQVKIGVNVNRWVSQSKPNNILDVIGKSLEIAIAYRHPLKTNEVLIEPHLEAFSPSDFKRADGLMEAGYRAATSEMQAIRGLLKKKVPDLGLWARIKSWFEE